MTEEIKTPKTLAQVKEQILGDEYHTQVLLLLERIEENTRKV